MVPLHLSTAKIAFARPYFWAGPRQKGSAVFDLLLAGHNKANIEINTNDYEGFQPFSHPVSSHPPPPAPPQTFPPPPVGGPRLRFSVRGSPAGGPPRSPAPDLPPPRRSADGSVDFGSEGWRWGCWTSSRPGTCCWSASGSSRPSTRATPSSRPRLAGRRRREVWGWGLRRRRSRRSVFVFSFLRGEEVRGWFLEPDKQVMWLHTFGGHIEAMVSFAGSVGASTLAPHPRECKFSQAHANTVAPTSLPEWKLCKASQRLCVLGGGSLRTH